MNLHMRLPARKAYVLVVLGMLCLASCTWFGRRVKLGEEFWMKPDEKVSVAQTDMTIQLKSIGHQWYVDRQAESPYAELIVSGGGGPSRSIRLSDSVTVGDYTIKLKAANPFGNKADCKLLVTRN
jgi:hypothetical protein